MACILCDKTTAFDCVSHEVLLSELELHRVTGIVLNWFKSYLHDRKLENLKKEMQKNAVSILGVSEVRWKDKVN